MKKTILGIIGVLALGVSIFMFIKKDNPRLTEFQHTWWIPLPIAGACFVAAGKK